MGPLTEIGNLLVHTLFSLYLIAVLLRLLLQMARADFYNPLSQFLVKATNPLLQPLRRMIPGLFGIDMAAVVLAVLVQMLAISALLMLNTGGLINPLVMFLWAVIGCAGVVANIYFFAIIVSIIVSWVAPQSYNPLIILLHQLTEPVMAPFRKLIPPMGGLDLSPIFVFLTIQVLEILLKYLGAMVGMYPQFVIGI